MVERVDMVGADVGTGARDNTREGQGGKGRAIDSQTEEKNENLCETRHDDDCNTVQVLLASKKR